MKSANQQEKIIKIDNSIDLKQYNNGERKPYGFELILDLHGCNVSKFNRKSLRQFFIELCEIINMKRCKLCFWDDVGVTIEEQQTSPHTKGTSAVQFILTSTIVIHTLDLLGAIYINIFSCKNFNEKIALNFTKKWFSSTNCTSHFVKRL